MHPNQQTLEKFYSAFAQLDPDAMARCYATDATFDDEAFSLRGHEQVTGMWHMLCDATRAKVRKTAATNLHTYLARRKQGGH